MKVGVIGGGILGLALAYYLARDGAEVTVFEGKPEPGGLLQYIQVDDYWIDKYYHCILSSDSDLLRLVDEIGLSDQVRFTETKQGFFRQGKVYPITSSKDVLLFPPLSLIDRFRLGLTVLAASRINNWDKLEEEPVEDWLVRLGGRGTFEKLWKPLLRAKFDGNYQRTPATYIWSRLKRTTSTREGARQKEKMGYFVGSYRTLINRLVERIEAMGGKIQTGARVQEIIIERGQARGIVVDGAKIALDQVIATTPLPVLQRLVPDPYRGFIDVPESSTYLGVICGLLLLDRPLSPNYTMYIADEKIPFTGLIETTSMIAPEHVGGYHLVYLPKYVTPDSPFVNKSDDEFRELYVTHLERMFPAFRKEWIRHSFVFRERLVEPLHQIGKRRPIMPVASAINGMFIVNNAQIYPDLTNCQSSVRHALNVLPTIEGEWSKTKAEATGAASVGERRR